MFDKFYKKNLAAFSRTSWEIIPFIDLLFKGDLILDIGGGQGRCTIPLLKKGFHVDLVDTSQVALNQVHELLEKSHNLNTFCVNMEEFKLTKSYNGILACCSLQYFPSINKLKEYIHLLKTSTKPYGLNIFTIPIGEESNFEISIKSSDFFRELYYDWNIISCVTKKVQLVSEEYTDLLYFVAHKVNG